jgi:hypothetical protein
MRNLQIVLIIAITGIFSSYSQTNNISLTTLENLTKMSSDQFEDWAIINGFKFDKIEEYEYFKVISYKKVNKSYIGISINYDGSTDGSVNYQTTSSIEYLNLKKSCVKNGYKYVGSDNYKNDDKSLKHSYVKNNYEIMFSVSDGETYYGYSIGIGKTNH